MKIKITNKVLKDSGLRIVHTNRRDLWDDVEHKQDIVLFTRGKYGWNYSCVILRHKGIIFALICGDRGFPKCDISHFDTKADEYETILNELRDAVVALRN